MWTTLSLSNWIRAYVGGHFLWAVMHLCIGKISRKEAPATYQQMKQGITVFLQVL